MKQYENLILKKKRTIFVRQIKRREAEKEMLEREEAELQRKKDASDQLFLSYQQEKDKQRNQDAQAISQIHLRQVVRFHLMIWYIFVFSVLQQERKDRQRDLKANEINEVQLDKHMNEVEREQYQDYTGRVISYMEETGRNTYPLKRVCLTSFYLVSILFKFRLLRMK